MNGSEGIKKVVLSSGVPVLLFSLTFIVYYHNLCRNLYWMDSGEFVFHATVLGIPHPTGYPLYIQLGKLLTFLPGLTSPFAINLFSALMASMTCVILYRVIMLLEGELLAAATAVLLFAFSFTFWSQAEIAEVYTLQTFFLALMIYLLFKFGASEDRRIFYLLSFVLGMSFTHHMSTVLMVPALIFFLLVYMRVKFLDLRTILPSLIFFVIGLSIYLFIPMRAHLPPPFNYPGLHGVDPGEWSGFLWLLTGKIVKVDMFEYTLGELGREIGFYFQVLIRDFVYAGFFLGVLGAVVQHNRDRRAFYTILLAFSGYFVFFVNYGVIDKHVFFPLSFLFWSIWIGVGLANLVKKVCSLGKSRAARAVLHLGLVLGMLCLIVMSFQRGFRPLDFSERKGPDEFTRNLFDRVDENSLILSIYEATPLLWYHHYVGGRSPGVEIIDRGLMSLNVRQEMMDLHDVRSPLFEIEVGRVYKERLEELLISKSKARSCYLVRYDAFLNDRFLLQEIEKGLYKITVKEEPAYHTGPIPPISFEGSFRYKDRIDLFGVDLSKERLTEGDLFRVGIYWSAVRPLRTNYFAFLRFMRGEELKEHELKENSFLSIYMLGSGMISHEELEPGLVVADDFNCMVPPDVRGGDYRVSLALVEEERFYSTPRKDLQLAYLDLGNVTVSENPGVKHYWD